MEAGSPMGEANEQPWRRTALESPRSPGTRDESRVAALFKEHGPELRRFILGVVRDPDLAEDVVQTAFTRAVEQGHTARDASLKSWLFQVAYHEAITVRRRQAVRDQAGCRLAALGSPSGEQPDESLIRVEQIEAVRRALASLPPEQRRVVQARIYEDKTFAQIAGDDGLPLGTVLTRMRLALERMRRALRLESD
jgi:RNA polymerase sigma-70 factor (ECF subfamily)